MSTQLVKQGHYILGEPPPCGTNGLGTCVGVAINHDAEWFIAHIDCAAQVKSKKDPMWQRVANYVRDDLSRTMSACYPNYKVHVVGEWDGFVVTAQGTLQKLKNEANNTVGDGGFSVPQNP